MATTSHNTDGPGGLPTSVVDDLLADQTRRRALDILATRGEPLVVDTLATAIVAAREDCPETAVTEAQRESMREELYTDHIPKLTATAVLSYDSMTESVELTRPGIVEG